MTILLIAFLTGGGTATPSIWCGLTPGPHHAGIGHSGREGLEITYWYPARLGRTVHLRDLTSSPRAFAEEAGVDGLPEEVLVRYGSHQLYAKRGGQAVSGRYPLVLMAQGNQQRPFHQAVLAEWLASHGFVVASAASTTIASPMKTAEDVGAAAQREAEQLQAVLRVMSSRSDVDTKRVVIAGHSFGARAALLLAMKEPSVRGVLSLDGGIGTSVAVESFRTAPWFSPRAPMPPILHLYETVDSFMSPDFTLLRSLQASELTLVEVPELHHVHFTTLGFGAAADPKLAKIVGLGPGGAARLRDLTNAILAFLRRL
jgi:dienelactone hydrolase